MTHVLSILLEGGIQIAKSLKLLSRGTCLWLRASAVAGPSLRFQSLASRNNNFYSSSRINLADKFKKLRSNARASNGNHMILSAIVERKGSLSV